MDSPSEDMYLPLKGPTAEIARFKATPDSDTPLNLIKKGEMPPPGEVDKLAPQNRKDLIEWLEGRSPAGE